MWDSYGLKATYFLCWTVCYFGKASICLYFCVFLYSFRKPVIINDKKMTDSLINQTLKNENLNDGFLLSCQLHSLKDYSCSYYVLPPKMKNSVTWPVKTQDLTEMLVTPAQLWQLLPDILLCLILIYSLSNIHETSASSSSVVRLYLRIQCN